MTPPEPARIHLIPAKNAPLTLVLRRKPSKAFNIFLWNTDNDHLVHGSRFTGKLYVEACDLSLDGKWMSYQAIGRDGASWSGLCQPPYLRTVAEGDHGPGIGGGVWLSEKELCLGYWNIAQGICPFEVRGFAEFPQVNEDVRYGVGFLLTRLRRDGWKRVDGLVSNRWSSQPGREFPTLYLTIDKETDRYTFQLDGHDDVVDENVSWAAWDCKGNLIFARLGVLYRFDLEALQKRKPSFKLDLEQI